MRVAPGFAAASLALVFARTVFGSLYVVSPTTQTVCHGGQPCVVQWLDDGQEPLLATMGPCYVTLFGNEKLIQQIEPVDVSTSHSLTFTPNPKAGPNSNTYYLAFTSVNAQNPSHPLRAFSANFSIDWMSGSFKSPVPELTSMIPVPSSVLLAHPNPISTLALLSSTSLSTMTTRSSSSSLSASPTSLSSSLTPTTSARLNAATRQPLQLWAINLVGLFILFLL